MTLADEVKIYREKHGVSLFEARRVIRKKHLVARIEDAKTVESMRGILTEIVEQWL